MNRELFEKIANSDIALHSSFAVWDDSDITNIKVISSSVDKLTSEIVIVGLNPSGSKKTNLENRLRNFHWKYRGCKDYYLRAAFQQPSSRFKGAFMTDIVIDNPSKSQTSVKVSNTSLQRFIDELEFIQFFTNPNPIIIALGQKVYSTLAERDNLFERGITFADFVLQNHKKTIGIKSVSHHARKGYRKEDFVEEISKLSRQI